MSCYFRFVELASDFYRKAAKSQRFRKGVIQPFYIQPSFILPSAYQHPTMRASSHASLYATYLSSMQQHLNKMQDHLDTMQQHLDAMQPYCMVNACSSHHYRMADRGQNEVRLRGDWKSGNYMKGEGKS